MMRAILLTSLLIGALAVRAEEAPPVLEHDPFQPPARLREAVSGNTAPRAATASAGNLLATVVAGDDSMANVGGVTVKLGEELDGYRLVEVSERRAVFERDGKRRVLRMR
jgi:hypothetical protein